MDWLFYVVAAAVCIVVGIICFILGSNHRKKKAESQIGSAETEANRILSDAMKNAEARKKEAILEAKDEIHHLRSEADKEIKELQKRLKASRK